MMAGLSAPLRVRPAWRDPSFDQTRRVPCDGTLAGISRSKWSGNSSAPCALKPRMPENRGELFVRCQ